MPAKSIPAKLLLAPAAIALVAALAATAPAQRAYQQDEIDKSLRTGGLAAKRYAQQPGSDPAEEQRFRDYFQKYYFPAMTQSSPEALEDLGEMRYRLFRDFISSASGAKRQFLLRAALQFAAKVYQANYHPAVRYNGLLILGMLDEQPASGDNPAKPMAQANQALCQIAKRATADGRRPRYELAGALVGLQRHARSVRQLPRDRMVDTAKTLHSVLTAEDLPGQYEPGVKAELFIQAATALANLQVAGGGGVFPKAIAQRAADEQLSLEARAEIASQLSRIPMQEGQFDGASIGQAVRDLAVAIVRREADYANRFEEMNSFGMGRGMPASRDAFSKRLEVDEQGEVTLRLGGLIDLLVEIKAAAEAAQPVAPEAERAGLTEIAAAVTDAIRVAADEGSVSLDVTDAIKRMASRVEAVAAEADAARAAAEAAAAEAAEAAAAAAAETPPSDAPGAEAPAEEAPSPAAPPAADDAPAAAEPAPPAAQPPAAQPPAEAQ